MKRISIGSLLLLVLCLIAVPVFSQDIDDDGIDDGVDNCPGVYNPTQDDTYPPDGNGCGDACECEGNFNGDGDCDGTDAGIFKLDYGRLQFDNPCESGNPCNGDFNCDGDVDGTDASLFKKDYGRLTFDNPCPTCEMADWCNYNGLPPIGEGITLPMYTADDVTPNPVGEGFIIGGQLIIDFDDTFTLDHIDSILEANGLERIGFFTGVNQVIGKIINGASELEAQAAIAAAPGIEAAALDFMLDILATSGAIRPLLDIDPVSGIPREPDTPLLTLSQDELDLNWPHYVMDTFPAHALADAVIGGSGLQDIVLGVIEPGDFQRARVNSGDDSQKDSLLYPGDDNLDLGPKVVDPTGIVLDPDTGPTLTRGTRDPRYNSLIGSGKDTSSLHHGLAVASAALGAGPHILGTSRHAKFRPIAFALGTVKVCGLDYSIICDEDSDCGPGAGTCHGNPYFAFIHELAAVYAALANEDAKNLKVVNVSMGLHPLMIGDEYHINMARRIIGAPLSRLIEGGRIVVIASGNDNMDTSHAVTVSLGPSRSTNRNLSPNVLHKGLMVAAGTTKDGSAESESRFLASNHGSNISVSAPGGDVPALTADLSSIAMVNGTSFSSPYIAGLAAEMFTVDSELTNVEVATIIENTADDLGDPDDDNMFGYGRINLWKAILTVLNRKNTEQPKWLGINLRWADTPVIPKRFSVPDQILIDGDEIPGILVARVPDMVQVLGDNWREIPNSTFQPYAAITKFSFETAEITDSPEGLVLIEARETGEPIYQIPVRLSDLLDERPVDSSIDDFVITLDVHTQAASVYGKVTEEGSHVPGATVSYVNLYGNAATTITDVNGYYTIYDALPDQQFEISAYQGNSVSDAYDITVTSMLTQRRDFELVEEACAGGIEVTYILNAGEEENYDPTPSDIANADIWVSGDVDSLMISWNFPAYLLSVDGSNTGYMPDYSKYRYSYGIAGKMDGKGGRYTINPPVEYGDYDIVNTEILTYKTQKPSPPLTDEPGNYYNVEVTNQQNYLVSELTFSFCR